jgi:hypothetical protein
MEIDGVTMPAPGQQQLAQKVQPLRRSYGIQVNHQ